jgi:hypothetical protein
LNLLRFFEGFSQFFHFTESEAETFALCHDIY